jgi:hypothetical protein
MSKRPPTNNSHPEVISLLMTLAQNAEAVTQTAGEALDLRDLVRQMVPMSLPPRRRRRRRLRRWWRLWRRG